MDAQMCIYDASCDTHFGFCCDIDEDASLELASKVLSPLAPNFERIMILKW